MSGIFGRYHACKDIIDRLPDGENKTRAESILRQLLHIEQVRKVAHDGYNRYRNDMNEWENNLVRDIKRLAEEVPHGQD